MTPEQQHDERMNVLAFIAVLLVMPLVVGVFTLSWQWALATLAVVELLVVAVAFAHMDRREVRREGDR